RLARPSTSVGNEDTVSDNPLNVLVEGVGWRYVLKGLPANRLIEACGQRDYLSDLCPRAVISWLETWDVEDAWARRRSVVAGYYARVVQREGSRIKEVAG